ncbi:TetR/AcrR family transcriptional regulator [Brasilonema sp. UFV-L1]|uniref:TetR/AcrR family transcriptional regulator n=1 Tax=Brasilonema sp. UFV-L1 TaxID=2234130 RepID=UPI00145E8471|nr:TetR/AcrR family transcriptional regulator [Brasilonema sp. UFV-L1]NMG05937.1 TetR/AcrR family transcriptional regulator [Brasilonema sp. UFV-L1]
MSKTEANNRDRKLSDEKMDAILAGAMQEFLEHGYAATTMDRVTAAAGVSKTTVYSHFQDKEGLFTALMQQLVLSKYYASFNPQKAQLMQGEASIILRQLAFSMLNHIIGDQQVLGLMRLIVSESGRFPELARAFVLNIEKPFLEDLCQFLESRTELNLPDSEVAARVLVGTLVHFILISEILYGKDILPIEPERLINNLIDLLTINQTTKHSPVDQYSGTRQKSSRRNRKNSGQFEQDYNSEPKRLRSIRLTDTAWEKLAQVAAKHQLTRSEMIEIIARDGGLS